MSIEAIRWAKQTTFGSPTKKLVMQSLADYADEEWSTFVGQERLSAETELGERTVRRTLKQLEDEGWLCRHPRFRQDGTRTSDRTQLLPANMAGGLPATDDATTGHSMSPPPARAAGDPLEEPSVEPPDTSRTPPSQPQVLTDLVDALEESVAAAKQAKRELAERRFERWWEQYPKRNGKRVGKAKTKERWMRLSSEEHEAAWVGVRNYAASGWLPKDPERWLRDRLWEDWQTPADTSSSMRSQSGQHLQVVQPDRPNQYPFNAREA